MSSTRWYVYMIRTKDAQLYTGITTDIQRRWNQHTSGKGGARYFRAHTPESVVFLEEHSNRSAASKREASIKSLVKTQKELLILTEAVNTHRLLEGHPELHA